MCALYSFVSCESEVLRDEVHDCVRCTGIPEFERPAADRPFYKFPPTIGSQGPAPLLFIGINPRRTDNNRDLHDQLMSEPAAFSTLALNRLQNGRPYIALGARERHYQAHMQVVEEVFGRGVPFESKAAVTELFLCASPGTPAALAHSKSPCAERYLGRVLDLVRPKVVIAVGSMVFRHLNSHFEQLVHNRLVRMPHPGNPRLHSGNEMAEHLRATIEAVRRRVAATDTRRDDRV